MRLCLDFYYRLSLASFVHEEATPSSIEDLKVTINLALVENRIATTVKNVAKFPASNLYIMHDIVSYMTTLGRDIRTWSKAANIYMWSGFETRKILGGYLFVYIYC
jgi:hypothetical protein